MKYVLASLVAVGLIGGSQIVTYATTTVNPGTGQLSGETEIKTPIESKKQILPRKGDIAEHNKKKAGWRGEETEYVIPGKVDKQTEQANRVTTGTRGTTRIKD